MFKIRIQKYCKNTTTKKSIIFRKIYKIKDIKNFEKLQKYILNVALKTFCINHILYTPGKNIY